MFIFTLFAICGRFMDKRQGSRHDKRLSFLLGQVLVGVVHDLKDVLHLLEMALLDHTVSLVDGKVPDTLRIGIRDW